MPELSEVTEQQSTTQEEEKTKRNTITVNVDDALLERIHAACFIMETSRQSIVKDAICSHLSRLEEVDMPTKAQATIDKLNKLLVRKQSQTASAKSSKK